MNKGIIVEVNKNYAIALNNSGIMEKILCKNDMKVGQKIFYFEEDIIKATSKIHYHNTLIKTFGTIAALFLIVFTFFQNTQYKAAYAVVSLDINPSIQIEVDSNKKIVKIEGINDDGKNIDFSNVTGSNINEGVEIIKQILGEKKYLDNNKEVLVGFAFTENKEDSNYEETVLDAIKSTFKTETITYVKADKESVEEAKTKGISLGRYEASLSANEDVKKNIEKIPVKEITSSIKDKLNVIRWEAQDEKIESEKVVEPIKDKENIQKTEEPATTKKTEKTIEKSSNKPINKISDESDKTKNNATSSETNNNFKKEDNGVLEVFPEEQKKPKESEDVSKKPEESISIQNNENKKDDVSGKIEKNEEIELKPKENKNK